LPDGLFSNQKYQFWVNFGGSCDGRCWYMYFMAIWYILWSFRIFYGRLVFQMAIWYTYFMVIWYIFPVFGKLYQEKSGNHAPEALLVKHLNIFY
jgi:hypothetical protein